jgi:hypothetical protein
LLLAQTAGKGNNKDYSSVETADSANTLIYSSVGNSEGINTFKTSFDKTADIANEIIHSFDKTSEGINNLNYSFIGNNKGINEINHSIPQKNEGIKSVNVALVQKGLRVAMPTRSHATIDKAARILTLLYGNPRQPHKILRHYTGLSETGMAKHIMMLKRKELVVRTAFQTYTLTQRALKIMSDAMQ